MLQTFGICPHCVMESLMAVKQFIAFGCTACLMFIISYYKGAN